LLRNWISICDRTLDLRIQPDVVADFLPPANEEGHSQTAIQHLRDRCDYDRMPCDMLRRRRTLRMDSARPEYDTT